MSDEPESDPLTELKRLAERDKAQQQKPCPAICMVIGCRKAVA